LAPVHWFVALQMPQQSNVPMHGHPVCPSRPALSAAGQVEPEQIGAAPGSPPAGERFAPVHSCVALQMPQQSNVPIHAQPFSLSLPALSAGSQRSSTSVVEVLVEDVVEVVDVVVVVPHTFADVAPQISSPPHVPHSRVPPQVPLGMLPHSAPAAWQVAGVQQIPFGRFPGGLLLTHARPQQLWSVLQVCPSTLH
jgi:hypothetical protein